MQRSRVARFLSPILLAVLPFLGACRATQGYAGERLAENEVAVLGVEYDAKGTAIWIESIDDFEVAVEGRGEVEVTPGRHVVHGRARGFGQPRDGAPYQIDFVARAGSIYHLKLEQPHRSERLLISIVDAGTNQTVNSLELWP